MSPWDLSKLMTIYKTVFHSSKTSLAMDNNITLFSA